MAVLRKWKSALVHLRNGTLSARLEERRRERRERRLQSAWDAAVLTTDTIETRIGHGVRMKLYRDSILSRMIYCESFERSELAFTERYLRRGDTFVDIGANIGLFTLVAGQRVGPTGQVHAFEPCKKTFKRLSDNVALNKFDHVRCWHRGLSDTYAELALTTANDGHDAWNSFGRPYIGTNLQEERVECETFDAFSERESLGEKLALVKLDVEGWETRVLSGASRLLSGPRAPTVLVEFTDEAAVACGSSCTRLYQLLVEMGFALYVYDVTQNRLIQDPLRESYPYLNLVATKHPQSVMHRLTGEK